MDESQREPTRAPLVVGGAILSYTLGSVVGYGAGTYLDPNFITEDVVSDTGVAGLVILGTAASGLAAHWISPDDDPLLRTVLGTLAVQGLYVLAIDQWVLEGNQLPYLLGTPLIAVLTSASLSSWD